MSDEPLQTPPPRPEDFLPRQEFPPFAALAGPTGERTLYAGPPASPSTGGGRKGLWARLTARHALLALYSWTEVIRDPTYRMWVAPASARAGTQDAYEANDNLNVPVGSTTGAIVWLYPGTSGYGQEWDFVGPSSVAVFQASGPTHSTGIVPDPGSTAGTAKFLREDATWAVPAGGGSAFSGARLVGNATPTFANGTLTDVTWLLDFDSGGYTSGASPYTTFSLAGGSTYLIGVDLIWNETATNGWRHVEIQDRNGAVIAQADEQLTATPGTCGLSCSTLYRPSLTGNIKVRASQTSGTNNRTVNANASFWVNKVG